MKVYLLLLPLIGVLTIIFTFVPSLRGGCLAIGLGALIASWALEKRAHRRSMLREKDLQEVEKELTAIQLVRGALIVSPHWDLSDSTKIMMQQNRLPVQVRLRTGIGGAGFVVGIRLGSIDEGTEVESRSVSITVDTGWLLFARDSLDRVGYTERCLRQAIQSQLKLLPENHPMILPLETRGECMGVVVTTGIGDGVYHLNIKEGEEGACEVDCTFM